MAHARSTDMDELIQLKSSLHSIFSQALPLPASIENKEALKQLQKLNKEMDSIASAPSCDRIKQAIEGFRKARKSGSFRSLRNTCYGISQQMKDGWSLLADRELQSVLFSEASHLEMRQRLKCHYALLSSYFSFTRFDEEAPREGWERLRGWLWQNQAELKVLLKEGDSRIPNWFGVLSGHDNLLTTTPCDRYGAGLLQGDGSLLDEVRQGLGIISDSWVMAEAVLAQIRAATRLDDQGFMSRLDDSLKIIEEEADVKISELLKQKAVASLVSRYARSANSAVHEKLRDAAVVFIGNPWLKRQDWDAKVRKADGEPDEDARDMVNGWLKRRLITDFFDVLSDDGRADQRRLKYWLRFEESIDDLWLALGPDARNNKSLPYQELRERAKGRSLRLNNPGSSSNNAFIMKMGDWLIVEFGMKGNACYVYRSTPMPFSLRGSISQHDLRDKSKGYSLRHQDGRFSWERKFDNEICPKLNFWPEEKPHAALHAKRQNVLASDAFPDMMALEKFAADRNLRIEDLRGKDGALWIYTDDSKIAIAYTLRAWGFKYRPGRGWWKE